MQFGRIIFIVNQQLKCLDTFAKKKAQTAAKTKPREPFSLKGFLDCIVEWICSSIRSRCTVGDELSLQRLVYSDQRGFARSSCF